MLIYQDKALVNFSYKLSKLHKSVLPKTVAFTLNDAAKDLKTVTLKKTTEKEFDIKNKRFFKAFSGYKQVGSGFNIAKMKSTAGMIKGSPKNSKSKASEHTRFQQTAGDVPNKTFMPAKKMRTSRGRIKTAYLSARAKKPILTKAGSTFAKDFNRAAKSGRPLLIRKNGKGVLVDNLKYLKRRKNPFKYRIVASYEKGREADLTKKRPFVNNAAIMSGKKLKDFYIKNAKKQIEKMKR